MREMEAERVYVALGVPVPGAEGAQVYVEPDEDAPVRFKEAGVVLEVPGRGDREEGQVPGSEFVCVVVGGVEGEVPEPGEYRVGLHPQGNEVIAHETPREQLRVRDGVARRFGDHDLAVRLFVHEATAGGMVHMGMGQEQAVDTHETQQPFDDVEAAPRVEEHVHGVQHQEGMGKGCTGTVVSVDDEDPLRHLGARDARRFEIRLPHGQWGD